MNTLDKQYTDLLQNILDNGIKKEDRTGTGTKSIFGVQIRHNMQEGFPLLTTKKMAWKQIVTELIWFLRGDTNIKYLVDNNCHIWDGDAYKNYEKAFSKGRVGGLTPMMKSIPDEIIPKDLFIEMIKNCDELGTKEFANKWGDLGPIYGKQWRNWQFVAWGDEHRQIKDSVHNRYDQIQNLINDLKNNPDSRRLMVNAWNVGEIDQMVLPPCHYGFQFYTRELGWGERAETIGFMEGTKEGLRNSLLKHPNKEKYPFNENQTLEEMLNIMRCPKRAISLMWNQRSVDTFLGLPFNIASYGLLLSIIAEIVNMVPDQLVGNLGDTHLYLNHLEQAKEQISRTPFELPSLRVNTEFWQTESGECGVGPLSDDINALSNGMEISDFQIENYQSHPKIEAPLSN